VLFPAGNTGFLRDLLLNLILNKDLVEATPAKPPLTLFDEKMFSHLDEA